MNIEPLERLDSFPYRHRVADLMTKPVVSLPPAATASEAARVMNDHHVSSIVVLDEHRRLQGILTERDVLRLVARGGGALDRCLRDTMTSPVHGIAADALIYRALARMARLGVRHLPVIDDLGHPVGMLTARTLLEQRASAALTLGDEIDQAGDAAALRAAYAKLAPLATALRREDVPATQVSAVVAGIVCDLTARSGEIALAGMHDAGLGDPPCDWCLLVLGSAGRGETLLAPDQDNALVYDGDAQADAWFASFGQRINALLDAAGVPLCKGGVMAGAPEFRKSLTAWQRSIESWVARPHGEALMNVDIFFDFVPVLGERRLARDLRRHATSLAAASPVFLRLLADSGERGGSAFDLLGRLRTVRGGIDLKRYGLFPVVAAARAIALAWRSTATATDDRLADAAARGALSVDTAAELSAARAVVVETILDQQLADLAAGRPATNVVQPRPLRRSAVRRLRHALERAGQAPDAVRDALTRRAPERAP